MEKNDIVNHPSHYTDGKIEVIDFIDDKKLGFCLGNAVKYISRAGKKDPTKEIEDLEKAIWYIKHHIDNLKEEGLNKDSTLECPKVKVVTPKSPEVEMVLLGNSKKIADKIDKFAYVAPKGLRPKTDVYDETNDTVTRVLSKEEEDKIWDAFYDIMHGLEPDYTREQFEKDLHEARQEVKRNLMNITKLYK